jgi:membrane protein
VVVLYFFAPAERPAWRDINLGAVIATISIVIASLVFSFAVSQFGHFTRLFGSLGTLIVTLLWLKMNALAVILGFELNMSVSIENIDGLDKR